MKYIYYFLFKTRYINRFFYIKYIILKNNNGKTIRKKLLKNNDLLKYYLFKNINFLFKSFSIFTNLTKIVIN